MTGSDWAFYILSNAVEWLWPAVHLFGLGLCVWAYRRCRKPGYLIIAGYYFLAVCSLVLGPMVNRALRDNSEARSPSVLSPEAEQRYMEELAALDERYYPQGRLGESNVDIPFGPMVLVTGLWFIARRETRRIIKHDAPHERPA